MADTKLKLPEKRTMNLYQNVKETSSKEKKVKALVIVLAVIFLLVAVVGRYGLLVYKNMQLKQSNEQLAVLEEQVKDFDKVKEEYDRYAKSYLSGDENLLLERQAFINVADNAVANYGTIEYISVVNNTCAIRVAVNDLDSVADIKREIENSDNVNGATITVADNKSKSGNVVASIFFTMGAQISEEGE